MTPGARVEVSVGASEACPAARFATGSDTGVQAIARSAAGSALVEDIVVEGKNTPDGETAEEAFAADDEHVYRLVRDRDDDCACNRIERHGCPVHDIHLRDGDVWLLFYAGSLDTARDVIDDLNATYESVSVRRILQSHDESTNDLVFIDRSEFTDRQREVLRTAHEMGYFEHPRDANASEVAETLGISVATFTEHLATAQRKLTDGFLSD